MEKTQEKPKFSDIKKTQEKFTIFIHGLRLDFSFQMGHPIVDELAKSCRCISELNKANRSLPQWMDKSSFTKFVRNSLCFFEFRSLEENWNDFKMKLWYSSYFKLEKTLRDMLLKEAIPALTLGMAFSLGYEIKKKQMQSPLSSLDWAWNYTFTKCMEFLSFGTLDITSLAFIREASGLKFRKWQFHLYLDDIVQHQRLFGLKGRLRGGASSILGPLLGCQSMIECLQETNKTPLETIEENLSMVTWRITKEEINGKKTSKSDCFRVNENFFHFEIQFEREEFGVFIVFDQFQNNEEKKLFPIETGETLVNLQYLDLKEPFPRNNLEYFSFICRLNIPQIFPSPLNLPLIFLGVHGFRVALAYFKPKDISSSLFVNLQFLPNPLHSTILDLFFSEITQVLRTPPPDFSNIDKWDLKVIFSHVLMLINQSESTKKSATIVIEKIQDYCKLRSFFTFKLKL